MKKILEIKDVGKYLHFKNRKFRTPVTLEVNDTELKQIKFSMHMADVKDWKLYDKSDKSPELVELSKMIIKDVVIEELEEAEEDSPDTILGKYMKDGGDSDE